MKASTFCAAMCIAIAASSAPNANAATFGPRATAEVQKAEKPQATRRLVKHFAGPRGTIAVRGKINPDLQMVEDNSGSCHWSPRSGPRASLC